MQWRTRTWLVLDQRRPDTILRHVSLTFLIFCLLENYDDIWIKHGRHLPVDFCYTVYSTNTIRDALGHGPYNNSKYNTAYFVVCFTEIQAGRDEEKVPQSCRIFPTSAIQKLLIKLVQNRKLKSHVTVSCLLWSLIVECSRKTGRAKILKKKLFWLTLLFFMVKCTTLPLVVAPRIGYESEL